MAELAYERERLAIHASARIQAAGLVLATALFLTASLLAANPFTSSVEQLLHETDAARQQSAAALAVLSTMQDAETGQRGFLLTRRERYLQTNTDALALIEGRLATLARLAGGATQSMADQAELTRAVRAKVDELQKTVAATRNQGLPAALAIVNTDAGMADMAIIRTMVARIVARASDEQANYANTLRRRAQQVTTLVQAGLGGGIVLLGAAALMLVWNHMRLRLAGAREHLEAERLRVTVEHVPDGVAVFDRAARLVIANTRFAATLGIDPALAPIGTAFGAIASITTLEPPLLDVPPPAEGTTAGTRQGSRTLEVWRSPMPDGGQIVAVADISRQVAAEAAARQSQKMDVLGQMTGGVAHDFNNLLQVISANLELLRNRLARVPGSEPLLARLDAASGGVARGAHLTRHLLAFARRQPLAPEPVDAARLLTGMEEILRRTLGEGIQLELVIGSGLWFMRADPTQFENALLNLALNARDAMTRPGTTPSGRLTIEAANGSLGDAKAAQAAGVLPGEYVMFAIKDNGIGMTDEQRNRAVEPFYTTKPDGRGTGLGVPMVLGFAKQSGGHFQLYSELGRGTTARIYIPRTTPPASHAEPEPPRQPVAVPTGNSQLVLLVEDDPDVRRAAHDALLMLDYQVIEADSADAAVALLEAGCTPNLLFTDVVMPGRVSARQLVDQAREMLPNLGVLFTSGYTQNNIVHDGQVDADVTLLSKPWRQDDLARALRSVLDGVVARVPAGSRMPLVKSANQPPTGEVRPSELRPGR